MIIGITGTLGSGKSTMAEFLVAKGFAHLSVGTFLIEECKKRGLFPDRDSLRQVADDLRQMHGPDFIIRQLLKKAALLQRNSVIESIRAVGEVELLKKNNGYLLGVDADVHKRYARVSARGTARDHISLEEFLIQEEKEMHNEDPSRGNIQECLRLADGVIINDGSREDLYAQVEKMRKEWN